MNYLLPRKQWVLNPAAEEFIPKVKLSKSERIEKKEKIVLKVDRMESLWDKKQRKILSSVIAEKYNDADLYYQLRTRLDSAWMEAHLDEMPQRVIPQIEYAVKQRVLKEERKRADDKISAKERKSIEFKFRKKLEEEVHFRPLSAEAKMIDSLIYTPKGHFRSANDASAIAARKLQKRSEKIAQRKKEKAALEQSRRIKERSIFERLQRLRVAKEEKKSEDPFPWTPVLTEPLHKPRIRPIKPPKTVEQREHEAKKREARKFAIDMAQIKREKRLNVHTQTHVEILRKWPCLHCEFASSPAEAAYMHQLCSRLGVECESCFHCPIEMMADGFVIIDSSFVHTQTLRDVYTQTERDEDEEKKEPPTCVDKWVDERDSYYQEFEYQHDFFKKFTSSMEFMVAKQIFTELGTPMQTISDLTRTLLLFYQIFYSDSDLMVFAALMNYSRLPGSWFVPCIIAGIVETGIIKFLKSCFRSRDQVVTQSYLEYVDKMSAFVNMMVDSKVTDALRSIVLTLASYHLFSKDISKELYKFLGKPEKGNVLEAIKTCMEGVKCLFEVGDLMVNKGVTPMEAFFSENPMAASVSKARHLLLHKDHLYTGLKPRQEAGERFQRMDRSDYVIQARSLIAFFEEARKTKNPLLKTSKEAYAISMQLSISLTSIVSIIRSCNRLPPEGILLVGLPGIGKSNIIDFILKAHCDVRQRTYNRSFIFNRTMASEYWENYDPEAQPYGHWSEIGSLHRNIAAMQGDQIIMELCSVLDSRSYYPNQAFEGKGKIPCLMEVVIADCNERSLNKDKIVNNPSAIDRRFIEIEPIVKPQYKKQNGSCGIDYNRCNDGTPFYDRWYFRVTTHDPVDLVGVITEVHLHGTPKDDIHALYRWLTNRFRSTYERETDIQRKVDADLANVVYGAQELVVTEVKTEADCQQVTEGFWSASKSILMWSGQMASNLCGLSSSACLYLLAMFGDEFFSEVISFELSGMKFLFALLFILMTATFFGRLLLGCFVIFLSMVSREAWRNFIGKQVVKAAKDTIRTSMSLNWENTKHGFARAEKAAWNMPRAKAITYASLGMGIAALSCISFALKNRKQISGVKDAVVQGDLMQIQRNIDDIRDKVQFNDLKSRANVVSDLDDVHGRIDRAQDIFDNEVDKITEVINDHIPNKTAKLDRINLLPVVVPIVAHTESKTEFKLPSKDNVCINDVEEIIEAGLSYKRTGNSQSSVWVNLISNSDPCIHTGTPLSLWSSIRKNVRVCKIEYGNIRATTEIIGILGNLALINTHALANGTVRLRVCTTGRLEVVDPQYHESEITPQDHISLGNDLSIIKCSAVMFSNVLQHINNSDMPKAMEGCIGGDLIHISNDGKEQRLSDEVFGELILENRLTYIWEHAQGRCGRPIIASRDKGACIVGMHIAGHSKSHIAFGMPIKRTDIEKGMKELLLRSDLMPIYSQSLRLPKLYAPAPKSVFNYEKLHCLEYYGKIEGPVLINKKSRVRRTFINSEELDVVIFEHLNFIRTKQFGPPCLEPFKRNGEYISPYNNVIKKIGTPKKPLDRVILERIVVQYSDHIVEGLRAKGVPDWKPLTMECAINGAPDDAYTRAVNASTSAGLGWPGKKGDYLPIVSEQPHIREADDATKAEVMAICREYEKENISTFIFASKLKDEPREVQKIYDGKTRLYNVISNPALIVSKMLLSPFYTHMVEHGDVFCTAIGINMHMQAGDFYNVLRDFSSKLIELDYADYDTKPPFDIKWAASSVIARVCRKMGYTEKAMQYLIGVLSDSMFPYIEMLLDVFLAPGYQPSGDFGTAEKNCIIGNLLLMYAFAILCPGEDFFENVLPRTYGDDEAAAVRKCVQELFNNITYQKAALENYGMTVTPADKAAEMSEFVDIDDVSFLKRTFSFDSRFGRIIAPLDKDSLMRSLLWYIPSKEVSELEQMRDTIGSFLRELMFHVDEKSFDAVRGFLLTKFNDRFCGGSLLVSFPTYQVLLSDLQGNTQVVTQSLRTSDAASNTDPRSINGSLLSTCHSFSRLSHLNPRLNDHERKLSQLLADMMGELKEAEGDLEMAISPLNGMSHKDIRSTPQYSKDPKYRKVCEQYIQIQAKVESLMVSIRILSTSLAKKKHLRVGTQSDVSVMKEGPIAPDVIEVSGNVTNIGGEPTENATVGTKHEVSILRNSTLELDDFFARPVQIGTFTLAVTTPLATTFDVWNLYFANPTVRAKLRNYGFINANLVVRIVISGNPFAYGKFLVCFVPWDNMVDALQGLLTITADHANMLTYLSQVPGAKVLDVKRNAPFDMHIPYISPQPMVSLFNNTSTALPNSTNFADLNGIGHLYFYTMNNLSSVSAAPSPISVFIYAWLEDVELGCPTGTVNIITTESLREYLVDDVVTQSKRDERIAGPVERIASSASSISDALMSVPYLAPFAKASSIVLKGLSSLASIFGWSVPTINTAPLRVKPQPYQNAANVIGYDTGKRITLDPMQELTVDPRIVGVVEDEMAISYLTSIESFLTTFNWNAGNTPFSTILFQSIISPLVGTQFAGSNYVQPTALCFSALPFAYWRGDIVVRIEVVCSAFHRGTLAILYEPNLPQQGLIDAAIDLNKVFIETFDIQQTQSVEFCIKWASPRNWLMVGPTRTAIKGSCGPSITTPGNYVGYANGYITIVPMTNLQSPDDSNIPVNVYIRAENMKYNQLVDTLLPTSLVLTESLIEYTDVVTESKLDDLEGVTCHVLNPTGASMDGICELHFGEVPVTFRNLVKRFVTSQVATVTGAGILAVMTYTGPIYPVLGPNYNGSITTPVPSLLNYLRFAYLAMRGGMKKRLRFVTPGTDAEMVHYKVGLQAPSPTVVIPGLSLSASYPATGMTSSIIGTVTFVPSTDAGVECEIPFYTNNLFAWSGHTIPFDGTNVAMNSTAMQTYKAQYETACTGISAFVEETAAAEDFSLMRFIAAPPFVA